MIAELGQIVLALGLFAALFQGVAPLLAGRVVGLEAASAARRAAIAQVAAVAAAFALLTVLHATSDFSVLNVAENSHTAKPFVYKVTGVWGNHEGSMLLWILILAAFGAAVALSPQSGERLAARTIAIQGLIAAAFLAFLIFTSNPFARLTPAPADGLGLNPLLQDPGLIIHPPFLYLGYVGYSIVFAFAVAGLIEGRIDRLWARAVRPWALASWVFLTIGIALGSWWAYYELGWGGFWAWDPVENASFMPWLAGTALIHSVRALETRDVFKAWTVLLAILAFSLSLVGTFLVRSGILTSVHAFAVDPARGVFILAILAAVIGGALTLFAIRGPKLTSDTAFDLASRETGLLANNILLVASCAIVFIGTFYPLFVDVVSGDKLSIGAPYFNFVFPFFVLPLMALLAPASATPWKRGDAGAILRRMWPAALAAVAAAALALVAAAPKSMAAALTTAFSVWIVGGVFVELRRRVATSKNAPRSVLQRLRALPRSFVAMSLAHFGLAVVA
ncbi:MAG: heme lyase CcmF/NrfE family subunit, partial [Pseudomonadota bacterium]